MVTYIADSRDYSPKAISIYKRFGPVFVADEVPKGKREAILKKANIIVIRLETHVTKQLIDKMPQLKIIAVSTTGLNHIDTTYAKEKGVKIISLRGRRSFLKNVPSTAEESMALMMALIRNFPWAFDDVKRGRWDRERFRGNQLLDKTLGLVGYGRLGRLMARYAKSFSMNIIAHDPRITDSFITRHGIEPVSFMKLFREADIVSLHVVLNEKTHKLVNERHFKAMKPNAYLINTSRGEIIDEQDLSKALKEKWIAGAALDVLTNESNKGDHLKNNPLIEYAKKNNNLLIVPHLGGATYEAMAVTEDFIAKLVTQYLKR